MHPTLELTGIPPLPRTVRAPIGRARRAPFERPDPPQPSYVVRPDHEIAVQGDRVTFLAHEDPAFPFLLAVSDNPSPQCECVEIARALLGAQEDAGIDTPILEALSPVWAFRMAFTAAGYLAASGLQVWATNQHALYYLCHPVPFGERSACFEMINLGNNFATRWDTLFQYLDPQNRSEQGYLIQRGANCSICKAPLASGQRGNPFHAHLSPLQAHLASTAHHQRLAEIHAGFQNLAFPHFRWRTGPGGTDKEEEPAPGAGGEE